MFILHSRLSLLSSILFSFVLLSGCVRADNAAPVAKAALANEAFPGTVSDFHGYICHTFTVDGCTAKVVEPKKAASGRPWIWRAEFWDAFPGIDLALLEKGYHLGFIDVGNTHGAPDALKHWTPFYNLLTKTYGLSIKPVLYGMSRGGLYVYRWAADNADKVGIIIGDAPVCDFKSWPAGKGKGTGSPADWAELLKDYHFKSEAEALAYKGNPIDILAPIAKAKIPIIHIVGNADVTVPVSENTDIMRERYLQLGGEFALIIKDKGGHHPHGLIDPTPVINFVIAHTTTGAEQIAAAKLAPKSGEIILIPAVTQ